MFHAGGTIGTIKVFQDVDAFEVVRVGHAALAVCQAFAADIAIFLIPAALFTMTVCPVAGFMVGNHDRMGV
jgi:hypothetical protein